MVRRAHLPSLQVCQDLAHEQRRDPETPIASLAPLGEERPLDPRAIQAQAYRFTTMVLSAWISLSGRHGFLMNSAAGKSPCSCSDE